MCSFEFEITHDDHIEHRVQQYDNTTMQLNIEITCFQVNKQHSPHPRLSLVVLLFSSPRCFIRVGGMVLAVPLNHLSPAKNNHDE